MGQTSSKGPSAAGGAAASSSAASTTSSPPVTLSTIRPGSIVLVKEAVSSQVGTLDASLVRAMVAAQKGGFFSAQQQRLATWTMCGLIVAHKGKPYIVLPTLKGIDVLPAGKQIQKWQSEGMKVAVRQLTLPPSTSASDGEQLTRLSRDLLQAALQGLTWDKYLPELQTDAGGRAVGLRPGQTMALPFLRRVSHRPTFGSPVAPSSSSPSAAAFAMSPSPLSKEAGGVDSSVERRRSIQSERSTSSAGSSFSALSDFARSLLKLLIPRVWAALMSISPQVEVELRRAFGRADHDGDGVISLNANNGEAIVRQILCDMRGGAGDAVTQAEVKGFIKLMAGLQGHHNTSHQSPTVTSGGGGGSPTTSGSVVSGSGFMSPCKPSHGGGQLTAVTLDHFLFALARRPFKDLPFEVDIKAVLGGEFVATVYEMMGLLPTRTAAMLSPSHAHAHGAAGAAGSPLSLTARSNTSASSSVYHTAAGAADLHAQLHAPTTMMSIRESASEGLSRASRDSTSNGSGSNAAGGHEGEAIGVAELSPRADRAAGGGFPRVGDIESGLGPRSPPRLAFGSSAASCSESKGDDHDAAAAGPSPTAGTRAESKEADDDDDDHDAPQAVSWPVTRGIANQPASRRRSSVASTGGGGAGINFNSSVAGGDTSSALAGSAATSGSLSGRRASLDGRPPPQQALLSSPAVHVVPLLSGRSDTNASRSSVGSGGGGGAGSGGYKANVSSPGYSHLQHGLGMSPTSSPVLTSGSNTSFNGGVVGGTIVVIDSTCGDLRHFTPSTFGSGFEPRLTLIRGKLEPEALIVVDTPSNSAVSSAATSATTVTSNTSGAGTSSAAGSLSTVSRQLAPVSTPSTALATSAVAALGSGLSPVDSPVSSMFRHAAAATGGGIPSPPAMAHGNASAGVNRKLAWSAEADGNSGHSEERGVEEESKVDHYTRRGPTPAAAASDSKGE